MFVNNSQRSIHHFNLTICFLSNASLISPSLSLFRNSLELECMWVMLEICIKDISKMIDVTYMEGKKETSKQQTYANLVLNLLYINAILISLKLNI